MTTQRHIIKRQVCELQVGSTVNAPQLQADVSRIYRQRIVPMIDRYCSELSTPERIHRLATLELNLGMVDLRHLEEDLIATVSTQLRALLAAHITADERQAEGAGANRKTTSQLELLSVFAHTGSVPWWTDTASPHLLDDCLQYLIHHAPSPLRQLLRELAHAQSPLQRIVQHCADRLLADLAAVLAPALDLAALPRMVADLVLLLQRTTSSAAQRPTRLRHLLWRMLMQQLSLHGEQETAWPPLLHTVLIRVAAELGVAYTALLADIHQAVQQDQTRFRSPIGAITATLYTEFLRTHEPPLPQAAGGQGEELLQWTSLLQLLRALAAQLPEPSQGQLLAALNRQGRSPRDNAAVSTLREVLQSALLQQYLPPALVPRWRAALQQLPVVTTPLDLSFSDTDELYIANAGLVILHPFLRHFLERLELLEERQFKDMASRQRAVGLLQYAVSEDPAPPEYLLPLNKTLCGMELDEVFDFGPPVTEAEADECTNLLSAVIANAPILKNMSIPGLRGTFLRRQGVLSSRDGAWLLRVERETYDVVLDRFPWTMQWVKLPWMDTPLRVEW